MTYTEWCDKNNCTHGHCKHECEHPQPFWDGTDLICGCCAIKYNERSIMIPCTPDTCIE